MGKQSARLYYQGKDHKDIYFRGNYHTAMYIGSLLAWEKLYENTYIEDGEYLVDIDSRAASTVSEYIKYVIPPTISPYKRNSTHYFSNDIAFNAIAADMYYSENLKQVYKKTASESIESIGANLGRYSMSGNIFFRVYFDSDNARVCIFKFAKENRIWKLYQNKVLLGKASSPNVSRSGYTVSDKIFLETREYKHLKPGESYPNETCHYITTVDSEGNTENNLACIEHWEAEHEVEYTKIITSRSPSIYYVFKNRCISVKSGGYDILSSNSLINTINTDIGLYDFVMKITDDYMDIWGSDGTSEYIVRFDGTNLTMIEIPDIEVPLYENGKKTGTKKVVKPIMDSNYSSNNAYYTKNGFKFDCAHWKQKEEDSCLYLYFIKDFLGSDENFCIKISNRR